MIVNLRLTSYDGGGETHEHVSIDGTRRVIHNHEYGGVNHHHGGTTGFIGALLDSSADDVWRLTSLIPPPEGTSLQ